MDALGTFMDDLAAPTPYPGGGAASAVIGALGCAQGQMVAAITARNPRYESVREPMEETWHQLASLRERFLALADEDARGYSRVAEALKLPRDTEVEREERSRILAQALESACDAPFSMLGVVGEALEAIDFLSREGSAMAASDVICAASMLVTCAEGAGATVLANTSWMADKAAARALEAHQARARELVRLVGNEVIARIEQRLFA